MYPTCKEFHLYDYLQTEEKNYSSYKKLEEKKEEGMREDDE